ncbi:carotenoid biosynthesis protein [Patescibacteria group bacterium]|nr:carotenoid biosynthesis protein [Patescibacteria group bacterium]
MTLRQRWGLWIGLTALCLVIGILTGLQSSFATPFLGPVSTLFVLIAALPGYRELIRITSLKRGLLILLALSLFAYLIEIVGVQTGFPYSSFTYAQTLRSFLIAGVPWTTPFGWVPLVLASYFVARVWSPQRKGLWIVFWSVLLLVTFDLVLDPGAVRLGLWSYASTGWYHAVPWQNFAGWLLTGTLVLFTLHRALSRTIVQRTNMFAFLIGPAAILSFWTGIALSASMVLPALIGCLLLLFFTFTWQAESTKITPSQ